MSHVTITFLGTGPAGRIPRPGCVRPACRDAREPGSRSRRLQSSLLIKQDGTSILFDAGQDIVEQLRRANTDHIDALVISHPHTDAMGGVVSLPRALPGQMTIPIYAERETFARIHQLPPLYEPVTIAPGRSVPIGLSEVRCFRVEHTFKKEFPTLGFDVHFGQRRLVLMSDVKTVDHNTLAELQGPDLCIMDCAIYTGRMPWHVNFLEAQAILEQLAPKETYLTQIGVDWPPYDEAQTIAQCAGMHIAYDGLTVTLE